VRPSSGRSRHSRRIAAPSSSPSRASARPASTAAAFEAQSAAETLERTLGRSKSDAETLYGKGISRRISGGLLSRGSEVRVLPGASEVAAKRRKSTYVGPGIAKAAGHPPESRRLDRERLQTADNGLPWGNGRGVATAPRGPVATSERWGRRWRDLGSGPPAPSPTWRARQGRRSAREHPREQTRDFHARDGRWGRWPHSAPWRIRPVGLR
jgi:hypothetical protein